MFLHPKRLRIWNNPNHSRTSFAFLGFPNLWPIAGHIGSGMFLRCKAGPLIGCMRNVSPDRFHHRFHWIQVVDWEPGLRRNNRQLDRVRNHRHKQQPQCYDWHRLCDTFYSDQDAHSKCTKGSNWNHSNIDRQLEELCLKGKHPKYSTQSNSIANPNPNPNPNLKPTSNFFFWIINYLRGEHWLKRSL